MQSLEYLPLLLINLLIRDQLLFVSTAFNDIAFNAFQASLELRNRHPKYTTVFHCLSVSLPILGWENMIDSKEDSYRTVWQHYHREVNLNLAPYLSRNTFIILLKQGSPIVIMLAHLMSLRAISSCGCPWGSDMSPYLVGDFFKAIALYSTLCFWIVRWLLNRYSWYSLRLDSRSKGYRYKYIYIYSTLTLALTFSEDLTWISTRKEILSH